MSPAQTYRIYCFDGEQQVWAADGIEAPNDDAAVEAAQARDGAVKKEVWQGVRLIASLDSASRRARSHSPATVPDWHGINPGMT